MEEATIDVTPKEEQKAPELYACACSNVFYLKLRQSEICPLCEFKRNMLTALGFATPEPKVDA